MRLPKSRSPSDPQVGVDGLQSIQRPRRPCFEPNACLTLVPETRGCIFKQPRRLFRHTAPPFAAPGFLATLEPLATPGFLATLEPLAAPGFLTTPSPLTSLGSSPHHAAPRHDPNREKWGDLHKRYMVAITLAYLILARVDYSRSGE